MVRERNPQRIKDIYLVLGSMLRDLKIKLRAWPYYVRSNIVAQAFNDNWSVNAKFLFMISDYL